MEQIQGIPVRTLEDGWGAIELAFGALGRALLVLDAGFRVLRASGTLNELVCPAATEKIVGRPIQELVHAEFFDQEHEIAKGLAASGIEEGRRAILRCMDGTSRLVSLTIARLEGAGADASFPARYLVVIRPAERDNLILQHALSSFGLVGRSPAVLKVVQMISAIHTSDASVLITGESGVGKEVVARALHDHSMRRNGPFVSVNCAALPDTLLEAELFGHVKGAFTGADRDRIGRFELAKGGTLFLDEIGDMPLHLQVKLLRVLQEKRFERVGESRSRPLEARIVSATKVDLKEAIEAQRFREDLYFRLCVIPIHIPPLRERLEDVEPIARHILARIAAREGRALRFSPEVLPVLLRYPWPGNVRELENALEYAVALTTSPTLTVDDLPPEIREFVQRPSQTGTAAAPAGPGAPARPPERRSAGTPARAAAERERILRALDKHHWRRGAAARELGISRTTLWRRMRELGLDA